MSHNSEPTKTTTKRGFSVWTYLSEIPFGWDVQDIAQKCEDALRYMGISQRKLNNNALGIVFRPRSYFKSDADGRDMGNGAYGSAAKFDDNFYRIIIHPDAYDGSCEHHQWNEEAVLLTIAHELAHVAQMLSGRLKVHTYSKKGQRETFTSLKGKKYQYYHNEWRWVSRPSEHEAEWAKFHILRDVWGMEPRNPTELEEMMGDLV